MLPIVSKTLRNVVLCPWCYIKCDFPSISCLKLAFLLREIDEDLAVERLILRVSVCSALSIRQEYRHHRTMLEMTPDADSSRMKIDEFAHDSKPEAARARLPVARLLGPVERLEDVQKILLRNTDAVV